MDLCETCDEKFTRANHLTYRTCQCLGFIFIYGHYLQFSNHHTAHPNSRLLETFLHLTSSITTIASARCRRNYIMGKMIGIQAITDPCWVHLCENKQVEQVIERIISACHPHQRCSTSEKEDHSMEYVKALKTKWTRKQILCIKVSNKHDIFEQLMLNERKKKHRKKENTIYNN